MLENAEWLSSDEIRTRLRIFNETHDYEILRINVPDWQAINLMYPHVMRDLNSTQEEHTKKLDEMFGPLPENYKTY